jgi:NAD+ kinase
MATEFRSVAVLGRNEDPRVAEPMSVLVEHLVAAGTRVLATNDMTLDLPVKKLDEPELAAEADLIIAIGGDGTMLYAGGIAQQYDKPLLGINRGRLGFLADVSPDEMLPSVDHILAGEYSSESRLLLRAELQNSSGEAVAGIALNDVVVQRRASGRMLDVVTSVAGQYVNTHSGDGLIISSPTGSTAYALSCGGPIIEPQLDAIVVVPICPHTLTDRPIVIPASQAIQIRILPREGSNAEVTIDGRSVGDLRSGTVLTIGAARNRLRLVHPPGYDFYGILRSKLFWGRDNRLREDLAPESC